MKCFIKTTLVAFCLALPTLYAFSQPLAPPVGPPIAGPAGPGRNLPPAGRSIQRLVTIQGTVNAYTASDSNIYDGLTLLANGQLSTIRFAPHLAASLMAAAKPGTALTLQGFYQTTPEGGNVVHLVSATAGSQTLYDGPPAPPANPSAETIQSFNGTITDLRRDRQGTPTGILLSGSRIVELTPGVYDQLQAYLKPGTTVSGSGSRQLPPPGVVLAQNIPTIHPHTLTVNGQTYMVW